MTEGASLGKAAGNAHEPSSFAMAVPKGKETRKKTIAGIRQTQLNGGWRVTDGGWRVTDGGWRVTDGGWRVTDGGWRVTDGILAVARAVPGDRPEMKKKLRASVQTALTSTDWDRVQGPEWMRYLRPPYLSHAVKGAGVQHCTSATPPALHCTPPPPCANTGQVLVPGPKVRKHGVPGFGQARVSARYVLRNTSCRHSPTDRS